MVESEVKITYEMLFELLRREKSRDELQKLDDGFFQHIYGYIKEKKQPTLETDPEEAIKSRILLENVHRLVVELYQRREKKIVEMALIKSRTKHSTISTQTLLETEKSFFNTLVLLLDDSRQKVLHTALHLTKVVSLESVPLPNTIVEPSSVSPLVAATSLSQAQVSSDVISTPPESHPQDISVVSSAAQLKKVIFKESVPKLIGEELEPYGPFNPGDTAELPLKLAQVLIEKEHAQEA